MIRRIAFHHTAETPAGLLNLRNKRSGLAICDYADLSAPVKGLPTTSLGKCMHLKEVIIPGATEIGAETFAGCKKLRDLWVSNKLETIASNGFPSSIKLTIHAPKGSFAEQYAKTKNYRFEEMHESF